MECDHRVNYKIRRKSHPGQNSPLALGGRGAAAAPVRGAAGGDTRGRGGRDGAGVRAVDGVTGAWVLHSPFWGALQGRQIASPWIPSFPPLCYAGRGACEDELDGVIPQ